MKNNGKFLAFHASFVLIILAAVVGGGVGAIAKVSLREIPPLSFTLLRFLLTTGILLPFIVRSGKRLYGGNLKKIIPVSLLAAANIVLFIFGVERTTATAAQTLYAGVPLIAGIFSYFLLRERIYQRKLFGLAIGFVGVLVIVLLPILERHTAFSGDMLGNALIFAGVSSFAFYSVLSKQFQKTYSPLELTAFFVLATTAVQLLLEPLDVVHHYGWWNDISVKTILGVFYVGVLGTGFYYLIYQYAIARTTPVVASMTLYLQPVFAFLWAAVLLGEKITAGFVIGAALTFIGVMLVTNFGRPENKDEFAAEI